jgi:hypothetical protein
MGAPLYYPSGPPPEPAAPRQARLSQKVHVPGGGVKWATYNHRHKSIELEDYNEKRHKKGLANPKNKKVRKNHHGFVVHNGQVYHIDKGNVEHVRELHSHEGKKGKKHHDKYHRHVEFHKEKKNVHHPLLDTLSKVIKEVKAKGRHKKDEPVPAFPDLTGYDFPKWFDQLDALHADFKNPGEKSIFRGKGKDLKWPDALSVNGINITTANSDLDKYREFSKQAGKIASALRTVIWLSERHRALSKPERDVIRNVLTRHGLHAAGAEIPEIDEAVHQLTRKNEPMKLTNRQEQVMILSHWIYGKKLPLEVKNDKGNMVPESTSGLYEMLKARNVVDEKTLAELFKHTKTLQDIMKATRDIRKRDKNREHLAAKKAAVPFPGQSAASLPNDAKASVAPAAAPSLVSMLYHR